MTADAPFDKEIFKPGITGQPNPQGKQSMFNPGDSITGYHDMAVELISPENRFINEYMGFRYASDVSYGNEYSVYDPISKKSYYNTHFPIVRQKNNLSMAELKAILDKDTSKTQAVISEQENGHFIEAFNVTKEWMRHELELFF